MDLAKGVISMSLSSFKNNGVFSDLYNRAKDFTDQIRDYKAQTELTRQEMATKSNEVNAEKRRVEEKQIRALRGNYRGQSLLGAQSSNQNGMSDKLGG